jgi:hypothetical protein
VTERILQIAGKHSDDVQNEVGVGGSLSEIAAPSVNSDGTTDTTAYIHFGFWRQGSTTNKISNHSVALPITLYSLSHSTSTTAGGFGGFGGDPGLYYVHKFGSCNVAGILALGP